MVFELRVRGTVLRIPDNARLKFQVINNFNIHNALLYRVLFLQQDISHKSTPSTRPDTTCWSILTPNTAVQGTQTTGTISTFQVLFKYVTAFLLFPAFLAHVTTFLNLATFARLSQHFCVINFAVEVAGAFMSHDRTHQNL